MLNLYHSSSVLVAAVLFLIATAAASVAPSASPPVYSVTNYGARADPKMDSTTAFLDEMEPSLLSWTYQEPGVKNVTVKTVNITETTNGLRIKTWGRPSSGFVRDVLFQHTVMEGVQNPILIDHNYCPGNRNCPGRASGVEVSDIRYWNVRGTSRTEFAVRFDCSHKANPCSGIQMRDVALAYVGSDSGSASTEAAAAACTNARGTSLTYVTLVVKCS
ncbi:unnamed protein product [Linum trigynum]|uniref:Uncharacterized protein n=1 Tax=Linum trigynum TaxID=586398 RepID=A0AAV2CFZ1_9ROSI